LLKNGYDEEGMNTIMGVFEESQTLMSVCGLPPVLEPEMALTQQGPGEGARTDESAATASDSETAAAAVAVSLCLPNKGLVDFDFCLIAAEIRKNDSITMLDISGNLTNQDSEERLGPGVLAIRDALKRSECGLTCIDVRGNAIGEEGGKAFAEALRENHKVATFSGIPVHDLRHGLVKKLDLSRHSLAACELVVLLQLHVESTVGNKKSSLVELNVSHNSLGPP
jgi:hypothetical protein